MCCRLKRNPQGFLLLSLLPEQQSNAHLNICQCKYQFTSPDEVCAAHRCHSQHFYYKPHFNCEGMAGKLKNILVFHMCYLIIAPLHSSVSLKIP